MNVKWEWVGLDLSLRMHTIKQQPILKLNKILITLSMNSQAGACGTREGRKGCFNLLSNPHLI